MGCLVFGCILWRFMDLDLPTGHFHLLGRHQLISKLLVGIRASNQVLVPAQGTILVFLCELRESQVKMTSYRPITLAGPGPGLLSKNIIDIWNLTLELLRAVGPWYPGLRPQATDRSTSARHATALGTKALLEQICRATSCPNRHTCLLTYGEVHTVTCSVRRHRRRAGSALSSP